MGRHLGGDRGDTCHPLTQCVESLWGDVPAARPMGRSGGYERRTTALKGANAHAELLGCLAEGEG